MSENTEANRGSEPAGRFSRRALIGTGLGSAAAGALAGAATVFASTSRAQEGQAPAGGGNAVVPFYGEHQAGIATPPQRNLVFASFGLSSADPAAVQRVLARWSAAMQRMSQGAAIGRIEPERTDAIPPDTGEATDLPAANLTLTLGFGPRFFDALGLQKFKPAEFELPAFPGDALQPGPTGGEVCVQSCADDPQVAYHAVRNLARLGQGVFTLSWTALGFGRASAGAGQSTPRNLMGFKDGTRNITDAADFDKHVWCGAEAPEWLRGGSFLVARKIQMLIETWDQDPIGDQQRIFGRTKLEGAPLTGTAEKDTPDFQAMADGKPVIDPRAHMRLASAEENNGVKILRRGYNYTDGMDAVGRLSAGLMFISYQRAVSQFVSLQNKLGRHDRLGEYIRHIGSGVFAVPPGLKEPGDYFGKAFFA